MTNRYHIDLYIDNAEVSHQDGEIAPTNSYMESIPVTAVDPHDAIAKAVNLTLPITYNSIDCSFDYENPSHSLLVDSDGVELTEQELSDWTKGKFRAYDQNITYAVYHLTAITDWRDL